MIDIAMTNGKLKKGYRMVFASSAFIFASTSSDQFPHAKRGANHLTFLWLWEPAGGRGLEDFSVARIFFYPLTNKENIFFQSKARPVCFWSSYLPQDFFFHSNKEWDSPTYYKTTEFFTQRFNGLHRFHTKKNNTSPSGSY